LQVVFDEQAPAYLCCCWQVLRAPSPER
jgi:hypothetical protein